MATFPPTIHSLTFGVLVLEEDEYAGVVSRIYSVDPVWIPGAKVRLAPEGVRLVIWPPEAGIADARAFVETIEALWRFVSTNIDRILAESTAVIQEAIDDFWQVSGPAPTLQALLDGSELRQINLNAGDEGEHVLILFDRADLIGSHDLNLQLDERFQVTSAYFDG